MYGCGNSTGVIIFFLAAERTLATVLVLQMARKVGWEWGSLVGAFPLVDQKG